MNVRSGFVALCALLALALPAAAAGAGRADVAALQAGLRLQGLYSGTIDGVAGPSTSASVRALQRRMRLPANGAAGPRTRAALGGYGKYPLGSRALSAGAQGWDVAALQFLLAWHGFPSGTVDGGFASHVNKALRRFQGWAGLTVDGVAGSTVIRALQTPPARCPIALRRPLSGPMGDRFGPRGARFHTGIDFPAPPGTPIAAAASGRVAYAGWRDGGWGNLVTVANGHGVRTMYAHLSRIAVRIGEPVAMGGTIGSVGATGDATGPHLHFEVRLRGAAVDPLTALL